MGVDYFKCYNCKKIYDMNDWGMTCDYEYYCADENYPGANSIYEPEYGCDAQVCIFCIPQCCEKSKKCRDGHKKCNSDCYGKYFNFKCPKCYIESNKK